MLTEIERIPMTDGARNSLIVIVLLWVMFAIAVVLRIVGRIRVMGLGLDDILSVIALISSGSTIGILATIFTIGVGWDFDSDSAVYPKLVNNLPIILRFTFAFTLIYIWSLASLKMSQLTLYMRVFANQLRIWVYSICALVMVWALTFNFLAIFLCDPVSQQWTFEPIGHCMDQTVMLKFMIMTNSAMDLLIVVLPMRSVWKLQMRKPEKIAVLTCFGLGGACVIISLAGFIQLFASDLVGNFTGTALITFMFAAVELMLAGLCINIPMLRPFCIRLRAKYKSSSESSSHKPSSHQASGLRQRGAAPPRPANYTAWIELADKDHALVTSDDDASPSRRITSSQPNDDGIHVQTEWVISRT